MQLLYMNKYFQSMLREVNNRIKLLSHVHHSLFVFPTRGWPRLKIGGISEKFFATPSTSLKISYYPLPTPIFSLILRKS